MTDQQTVDQAPARVTESSIDPLYTQPFIEVNELRDEPVPHRYVHGGFKGTPARFSFYFPPAEKYRGRFHHNTYPLAVSSDIGPFPIAFDVATGNLGFTIDSGAYYVQTNQGGAFGLGSADPSIAAYRANAAAAKYSRIVAAEVYGDHRPFGYLFGGSGGAYQTIGSAEHTSDVWDGFMPFVTGCNHATPSNFTVRMHALRVLRRRNKLPDIVDAVNPGGSGDIYADLNEEERGALKEVTLMGFPPAGWYSHETMDAGYFSNIAGAIPVFDPTYVDDFWTSPGYLGSDPASSIAAERFCFDTTVAAVSEGTPKLVELASIPDQDFANAHLVIMSGGAAGKSLPINHIDGKTVDFTTTSDPGVVDAVQPGIRVRIDNSWPLAAQTYHRHQIPPSEDYYGWNQFRDDRGRPIYPQREALLGATFTISSAGSLLSGKINGKMLLVQAHMDIDSFAWFADWYRSQVKEQIGPDFEHTFGLWFVDRAQHENPLTMVAKAHAVSATGALQQGLRDLSRWVEKGLKPSETRYTVVDSQVELPPRADERLGPQPVVELKANSGLRADVSVGDRVTFTATIETPPATGKIVAAEWDFEGRGDFPIAGDIGAPQPRVSLSMTHAYPRPGTYYAVLRATSQREGDAQTPYARVQNLARVRVVVK